MSKKLKGDGSLGRLFDNVKKKKKKNHSVPGTTYLHVVPLPPSLTLFLTFRNPIYITYLPPLA